MTTDPSQFYGKEGDCKPFIYDNGSLIYASKYKSKTGVFKDGKFISFVEDPPNITIHSEIADVTQDSKRLKSLSNVIHGRVGPTEKEANIMMSLSSLGKKDEENEIKQIVKTLKRFNLIKNSTYYVVGVFKDEEFLFYKVDDEDLKGLRPQDLSTHKIMRDRIYKKAGLEEGIKNLFSLLNEEL